MITGATIGLLCLAAGLALTCGPAHAQGVPSAPSAGGAQAPLVSISLGGGARQDWVLGFRLMGLLTVLSLAPAILILTTSFTRITIVLSFLRSGLGLGQTPATQLMIAYALFLTFLVMRPVYHEIHETAIAPYSVGRITGAEAIRNGVLPARDFMLKHTRKADLLLFHEIAHRPLPAGPKEIDLDVLLASFVTSELRSGFQMGFALLIPFVVIDLAVASILTSMGMMMLPPTQVALPFKILMFVLVDGWGLLARSLVTSYQ